MNRIASVVVFNFRRCFGPCIAILACSVVLCNVAILNLVLQCDSSQMCHLAFADYLAAPLIGGASLQPMSRTTQPIPFQWIALTFLLLMWAFSAPLGNKGYALRVYIIGSKSRLLWFFSDIVWVFLGIAAMLALLCGSALVWSMIFGADASQNVSISCAVFLKDEYLAADPSLPMGALASFFVAAFAISMMILNALSYFGDIPSFSLMAILLGLALLSHSPWLLTRFLSLSCYASISAGGIDWHASCIASSIVLVGMLALYFFRVRHMDLVPNRGVSNDIAA